MWVWGVGRGNKMRAEDKSMNGQEHSRERKTISPVHFLGECEKQCDVTLCHECRMLGGSHSSGHEEANFECLDMGAEWYSMTPA